MGGGALKETAEIAATVSIHNVCPGFLRGLCTLMRAFYWAYLDLRIHAVMLPRNFSHYDAILMCLFLESYREDYITIRFIQAITRN
jgi:hypothetical protein